MASIFDLKTNVSELSSANQGTSRMEYEQQAPTRDVTGNNFANGAIHYKWECSGQKWWLPPRTYCRTRLAITDEAGNPVVLSDDMAANMGLMSNLFQSMEFKMADKIVSRVSDFCPQIDALQTRLMKSSSWMDKLGASTNFWQDEFKVRQAQISQDGVLVNDVTSRGPVQLGGLDLSFTRGTTTIAYTAATGALVFAAGGVGNTDTFLSVGDTVAFSDLLGIAANSVQIGARFLVTAVGAGNLLATIKPLDAGASLITDKAADIANVLVKLVNIPGVNDAQNAGTYEFCWQPPLSIFGIGHALPSGKYELILTPQTNTSYQLFAIQSQLAAKVANLATTGAPTAGSNFKVSIVDQYMYLAMVEGPRADNITYLVDLEQTRCQAEKIDSISFGQKNFDVSPSAYALTVAYQDQRAGSDTRVSASLFRSYGVLTDGTVPVPQELGLNRFFINYAGQNLPAPDADPSFVAGTDYTIQRYMESQIYNGSYFDSGGSEDIAQFHKRGAYYYFSWPKDGTDRSTRVTVKQQFAGGTVVDNLRVLLFDHSKQVARVKVEDGRITDCQVEDA